MARKVIELDATSGHLRQTPVDVLDADDASAAPAADALVRAQGDGRIDAGFLPDAVVLEGELVDASAGAGDAGKPVKLNGDGQVDASMLPPTSADMPPALKVFLAQTFY